MKILNAGTEPTANAEVLRWIRDTKARHAAEDAEDKAAGTPVTARPKNFITAITKHERELADPKYPYTKNPKAYATWEGMEEFDARMVELVIKPCTEKYRGQGLTRKEIDEQLGGEQEMKSLTEPEHLMIHNLAPQSAEQLSTMLENCYDRFTAEELELIVQAINETYRKEEIAAAAEEKNGAGDE
ncbi:hypothetical protein LTR08_006325 [Meristemomyces frigidus]|nr:hypothetical protein LTR08_006325 [Meristemomyces frigidus]